VLTALKVGQEIEYRYTTGRNRWTKHKGRIQHITERLIAIQTARYPDCLALADLVSGHAVITRPAMDFSGVRLENRQEPELVGKAEPYITWKERREREGAEQMNVKYDWDTFGPRVVAMMAKGRGIPEIARELDYPYHAVRDYVKRHVPTKKPSEDTCPAGREECPHPADILPGGGLLPNATTLVAVDGDYQRRIFERFHSQRQKGIGKYGQPLEDNPASRDERLEHLAQELTDGLMYIEWLKANQPENGPLFGLPDVAWQSFPDWTIASQVKKIHEEAGEVAEAIINGDWVAAGQEALDTIQTCKTLLSMLSDKGLEVEDLLEDHADKLVRKGYV
jgi:NTP pyrophosphatase (non-canonical NTP hydrolase)